MRLILKERVFKLFSVQTVTTSSNFGFPRFQAILTGKFHFFQIIKEN